MEKKQVALVTGGSSGIGQATALALKEKGCIVYEISRRERPQPGIRHITADVTLEETVTDAVAQILNEQGRLDIVVNNAGFGISGAVEFTDLARAKRQFDVNFFGMVTVCKAVIPVMRAQGRGRIVNISSVAAPVAIPFQAFYSASKAAINSFTCALQGEVRPFGITLCAVMPGDIATGFTAAREKEVQGDDVYAGRIARSVAKMEQDERGGMQPAIVGELAARAATKKRVKLLYAVRFDYKAIVVLAKLLPASLLCRLVELLYAG